MRTLARFVTGRRTKWLVVAAWVVLAVVLAPLGSKLADKTNDSSESSLPKNAKSTRVVRLLQQELPGGQTLTGLVVYHRPAALTAPGTAPPLEDGLHGPWQVP